MHPILTNELYFKTSRSSGKGGQHVNKVSTRVELFFNVENSMGLSEEEKHLVIENAGSLISNDNVIHITCQEFKSQSLNKVRAIKKFQDLIKKCLFKPKKRIPTKTPKVVKEKRLRNKKENSQKKESRKKVDPSD